MAIRFQMRPPRWLRIGLVTLCLFAPGCVSWRPAWHAPRWLPRRKPTLDSRAGLFETAALVYRLDAGRQTAPLSVTRVEGQHVSYDEVPSSPLADQSVGTLSVTYPHPTLGKQAAAATVIVETA